MVRPSQIDSRFACISAEDKWLIIRSDFAPNLSLKGMLYGLAGRHGDAMHMVQELQKLSREQYVSPFYFSRIHFGMGDLEAWRKAVWEAYEDRSVSLVFLKAYPHLDPVKSDPVFQDIVRRVGLP
jgi:hypothetical protein